MNITLPANTIKPFSPPYDSTGVLLSFAFFYPLCGLGIVGNIITIATITWSPKLKSTWYDLIVSLSVSDLLSAIISPLFVYRRTLGFELWRWPDFLCKIFWAFDYATSYVTTIHILWFAILRFVSIQWPHEFNTVIAKFSKISIAAIWAIAAIASVPFWIVMGAFIRDRTDPHPSSKWPSCSVAIEKAAWFEVFAISTSIAFFCIPCVLVILFSFGIGFNVQRMRKTRRKAQDNNSSDKEGEERRSRKENQLLLQLYLIVGSFLLGYVPRTIFIIYTFNSSSSPNQAKMNWWFGFFEYLLVRISECLNPVFYNLSSSKMRGETFAFLRLFWCTIPSKNDATAPPSVKTTSSFVATTQV